MKYEAGLTAAWELLQQGRVNASIASTGSTVKRIFLPSSSPRLGLVLSFGGIMRTGAAATVLVSGLLALSSCGTPQPTTQETTLQGNVFASATAALLWPMRSAVSKAQRCS